MHPIHTLSSPIQAYHARSHELASHLEKGKVIYCINQPFLLNPDENVLLTASLLDGSHKNVSYLPWAKQCKGIRQLPAPLKKPLTHLLDRFHEQTKRWVQTLFPAYAPHLEIGRVSFRPAEIMGRKSSKRKDDSRLHVDAFPASPVQGKRILRVFSNIHPDNEPRIWHIGEPFEHVIARYRATLPHYYPSVAKLMQLCRITKSQRSEYDHYMLHLHNAMKYDDHYQENVKKTRFAFSAGSTWFVFTDHVSHAALKGQFALEQTFYLPVSAMHHPEYAPLSYLMNPFASKVSR